MTFNETLHPRLAGKFTDKEQSAPEGVVLENEMTADLTPRLAGGVLVVALDGADAAGVFPGADEIVVSGGPGDVSVTATIGGVNVYALALSALGGGDLADPADDAKATKWVHDNEDAVNDFFGDRGIELDGTYFDAQAMSVKAAFPDGAPVTLETAAAALAGSGGGSYLASSLNTEGSTLPADLLGYVQRYESDDNCRSCGEDSSGGEGFDGYCGNCADVAEQAGEWD